MTHLGWWQPAQEVLERPSGWLQTVVPGSYYRSHSAQVLFSPYITDPPQRPGR